MGSGGCPAGSGRALRLDPFALPVRYAAGDATADGRMRTIELHRTRVVVRRSLDGMRMALNMPVSAFAGVGLQVMPAGSEIAVAVMLAHRDPGLALPLYISDEAGDALAEWRSWGAVLGLPLLVEEGEGWREPFVRLGALRVERVWPRRRRRSALKRRRATMPLRRARGMLTADMPVYRGEREIIARN